MTQTCCELLRKNPFSKPLSNPMRKAKVKAKLDTDTQASANFNICRYL